MRDPVQDQMDAYNDHDLDRFVGCYSEDAVIAAADGTVLIRGLDEIRASYHEAFEAHPDLRAEVSGHVRAGDWVVAEEQAFRGEESLHVLVAYQVRGELICRVTMLR